MAKPVKKDGESTKDYRARVQAWKKSQGSGGGSGGSSGGGQQQGGGGSVAGGMFNMNSMFNQFMAMDPGENDDEGRSIKNTTMADAFTSAFQSELSKGMAQYQGGIAKDQMSHQQLLERQAAGEARRKNTNMAALQWRSSLNIRTTLLTHSTTVILGW